MYIQRRINGSQCSYAIALTEESDRKVLLLATGGLRLRLRHGQLVLLFFLQNPPLVEVVNLKRS
jgi:hypothetical protein